MSDNKNMTPITKVLVANRGEIAVRALQGAQRLGYPAVAVYSDPDANARHVQVADAAVHIGPASPAESYLNGDAIIAAARQTGANAIHPGYGFLSENAEFSKAVEDAGLIFIGPEAASIDLMGNKRAAKERMEAADVPCVPGYRGQGGPEADDNVLVEKAKAIGMPVMIKAAAGGGGRGMRLVEAESDLEAAIQSARSEAQTGFGNDELILEKAVTGARHVEIQVLADTHGNVIHLGERDCSVQRRHQKVVEESPCPVADTALREAMGQAAVAAASAINYRGAGTVEFLLDGDGAFYFMEMNTRLQVEHPVTELVTGIDLVEWQIRVAAGEHLTIAQQDVQLNGHAIEVRLCAEDPCNDFLPQSGPVTAWRPPQGAGIRVDHGVVAGGEVSPYYDSLQAKIIAWGQTRDIARRRLLAALDDCVFFGVHTNRDFLRVTLAHPAFASGQFDTGFIEAHCPEPASVLPVADDVTHSIAACLLHAASTRALAQQAGIADELLGWHSANATPVAKTLRWGREQDRVRLWLLDNNDGSCTVSIENEAGAIAASHTIEAHPAQGHDLRFVCDGKEGNARFVHAGEQVWLDVAGCTAVYDDVTLAATETRGDVGGSGQITANSAGKIMDVKVSAGDQVAQGDILLVLEAMKMEFQVSADVDGTVETVAVQAGEQVEMRQLMVSIAATDAPAESSS